MSGEQITVPVFFGSSTFFVEIFHLWIEVNADKVVHFITVDNTQR